MTKVYTYPFVNPIFTFWSSLGDSNPIFTEPIHEYKLICKIIFRDVTNLTQVQNEGSIYYPINTFNPTIPSIKYEIDGDDSKINITISNCIFSHFRASIVVTQRTESMTLDVSKTEEAITDENVIFNITWEPSGWEGVVFESIKHATPRSTLNAELEGQKKDSEAAPRCEKAMERDDWDDWAERTVPQMVEKNMERMMWQMDMKAMKDEYTRTDEGSWTRCQSSFLLSCLVFTCVFIIIRVVARMTLAREEKDKLKAVNSEQAQRISQLEAENADLKDSAAKSEQKQCISVLQSNNAPPVEATKDTGIAPATPSSTTHTRIITPDKSVETCTNVTSRRMH